MNPTKAQRLEALDRYCAADKSDPFARARTLTHMNNGVAGFRQANGEYHALGADAFYSADAAMETRQLPDGREYEAITYRNRQRP